jgi:hypothetical protein
MLMFLVLVQGVFAGPQEDMQRVLAEIKVAECAFMQAELKREWLELRRQVSQQQEGPKSPEVE